MKINRFLSAIIFLFIFSSSAIGSDYKDSALSWQKQATDTRGAVASVAEELGTIGDQGNTTAKGLIDDALKWLGKGDKSLSKGDA